MKATERKRTDSILAEGTKERMWRLNCFCAGCIYGNRNQHTRECGALEVGTHSRFCDFDRDVSNEYRARIALLGSLL